MTRTNEDLMALSNMMDSKLKPINDQLGKVEERLDKMDERFGQVGTQISSMQSDVTKVIRNYDIIEEFYVHPKEHNTLVSDRSDEVTGKLLIYTKQTEHNTLLLHDGV